MRMIKIYKTLNFKLQKYPYPFPSYPDGMIQYVVHIRKGTLVEHSPEYMFEYGLRGGRRIPQAEWHDRVFVQAAVVHLPPSIILV